MGNQLKTLSRLSNTTKAFIEKNYLFSFVPLYREELQGYSVSLKKVFCKIVYTNQQHRGAEKNS